MSCNAETWTHFPSYRTLSIAAAREISGESMLRDTIMDEKWSYPLVSTSIRVYDDH